MSTTFKALITVLAMVALLLVASGASAAVNRPGKARFEKTNGSGRQHVSQSADMRAPVVARAGEMRQSFSYEPHAKAAAATSNCHQKVSAAPAPTKQDTAAAPQVTRQSYSYEPATEPARSIRHTTPKKDPWLYPKGDPRRYR